MGIRKNMLPRIRSIGRAYGVVGLRQARLQLAPSLSHPIGAVNRAREDWWTAACNAEIRRLLAWEQRMETRPRRKRSWRERRGRRR